MNFKELHLRKEIEKALDTMGMVTMFPIQQKTISAMIKGHDCIVQSKTGSGKTLSYVLPVLQKLDISQKYPQAMIVCPTRELCVQVKQVIDSVGVDLSVKSLCLFGKQPFRFQREDLGQRCHVIIGTPGRILDHLEQGNLHSENMKTVILDEADRLLHKDFYEKIEEIFGYMTDVQCCVVSATMNETVDSFAEKYLKSPQRLTVETKNEQIEQSGYMLAETDKWKALVSILEQEKPDSCLIFCETKQKTEEVYQSLAKYDILVDRIHADRLQSDRIEALEAFKYGKLRILVATDVAARGIDIERLSLVINYDLPETPIIYTHRIGRSGRQNCIGKAITLVRYSQKEKVGQYPFPVSIKKWTEEGDLSAFKNVVSLKKNIENDLRIGIQKLYISAGKKKKIRAGDIVGALCAVEGIELEDIGVIQVQEHQSFVEIHNNKADLVMKYLKTIKKKPVRVEPAVTR